MDPVKQVKREIPSIWFHVKATFNNFQESAFGIHIKMTEKKNEIETQLCVVYMLHFTMTAVKKSSDKIDLCPISPYTANVLIKQFI